MWNVSSHMNLGPRKQLSVPFCPVPSPFTNPDFTPKPYLFLMTFFRHISQFDKMVNLVPITFGSKNCRIFFLGSKKLLSPFFGHVCPVPSPFTNPDLRPNRITFFRYFFVKFYDLTVNLLPITFGSKNCRIVFLGSEKLLTPQGVPKCGWGGKGSANVAGEVREVRMWLGR